eukprot:TRINITY_DN10652_c0_g1_i1.p1 TRINITY_DN10652_c0_g1~~TRINITY_DN10652_c0_g1_i1.p1  ORF type:complete len:294 (-),score=25.45 TRINITY_DN10652_c0_g1_i1:118-951(-)
MSAGDIDKYLKGLLLKDLRIQCRVRGISPAGGKQTLTDRLQEYMLNYKDFTIRDDEGQIIGYLGDQPEVVAGIVESNPDVGSGTTNNYYRPQGQNSGNFLTDRNSSRVLAPPGGGTHFSINQEPIKPCQQQSPMMNFTNPALGVAGGASANNYHRPQGQNVGNFISDRPSSKVLAPPGGGSSISFSGDVLDQTIIQKENLQAHETTDLSKLDVTNIQYASEPRAHNCQQKEEERMSGGGASNNYHRPGGQNLGNFITDRPSSRVLAAPGGGSSITFG